MSSLVHFSCELKNTRHFSLLNHS
uniref:Uncharacterized protein n=1 Tax=Arundo donax TaxID=35708 RepID=A0A0A9C570_ARUDO